MATSRDVTQGPAAAPKISVGRSVQPVGAVRRAKGVRLQSVLNFSAAFYVAFAVVGLILAMGLFLVAGAAGIVANIEELVREIGWPEFELSALGVLRVLSLAGLVFAVVSTALTVAAAFVYNLVSDLVGGVELVVEDESLNS